ncbi:MAG: RNA polymerase sigma factor [Maribacter sp.]
MKSDRNENNGLSEFFREEYQSLKRYVRSKITHTSESDAEDIIQEVALRIFSRPIDALPITNIGGFVYSAIRNRIVDLLRTRKTRIGDERVLEELWTEFSELFYEKSEEPYSDTVQKRLEEALTNLKPAYRDIIIAIDFEGYTYREISEETGIPQGTLMSQRFRALSLLNNILKNKKADYGK